MYSGIIHAWHEFSLKSKAEAIHACMPTMPYMHIAIYSHVTKYSYMAMYAGVGIPIMWGYIEHMIKQKTHAYSYLTTNHITWCAPDEAMQVPSHTEN